MIDDAGPDPDDPDVASRETAALAGGSGHVTATMDWAEADEDDPDTGSGRVWQ